MNATKSDYEYMKAQAVRASGSLNIIDDLIDAEMLMKRRDGKLDYDVLISSLRGYKVSGSLR